MVETGLVNALVTGIITGSVVALGAIGLALVYSIAEVPNFAHGELLTLGAYFALIVNVPGNVPGLKGMTDGPQDLPMTVLIILFLFAFCATLAAVYLLAGRPGLAGSWWPWQVSDPVGYLGHLVLAAILGGLVVNTAPSIWTGMLLGGLVLAVIGPLQEKFVFGKFREKGVDLATMLIVALGVSFVLRFTTQAYFGGQARTFEVPEFVSIAGSEVPLSAAQFFDFYITGTGLIVNLINTKTQTSGQFQSVLVASYSWPIVLGIVIATVGVGLPAYKRRQTGAEGYAGGQTIGPRLTGILAGAVAFGVAGMLLQSPGSVPEAWLAGTRIRVSLLRGAAVGIAVVMMGVLHTILKETKLGIAMRASSDNLDLAKVTGINTDRVMIATWIIAGTYAAVAGVMVGMLFSQITPNMGFFLLLPMFAAVILGGVGSVYGAIIGSFLVGLSMDVGIFVFGFQGVHRVSMAFAVLLIVLLIKPEGIAGGS